MSNKKIPLSLKITAATLPLVAITVAGLLIKKNIDKLMDDLNLDRQTKGFAKNVSEYPTKSSISKALALQNSKNHQR